MKTTLLVIFNNPFPKNIPILERLYHAKFDRIFYLIDSSMNIPGIVPVKGQSLFFQNFFLQASEQICGSDYYFITHDDALLNPHFQSGTAFSHFKLPKDSICIRNIEMIPHDSDWSWTWKSVYDTVAKNEDLRSILQSVKPQLIQRYQDQILPYGCSRYDTAKWENTIQTQSEILFGHGANSDILFMPGEALLDMLKCLQQLQAPDLFVEAAIPTAILMTRWKIFLLNSSSHAPRYYWKEDSHKHSLNYLMNMQREDRIAVHPVKFGKMNKFNRWLWLNTYLMLERILYE